MEKRRKKYVNKYISSHVKKNTSLRWIGKAGSLRYILKAGFPIYLRAEKVRILCRNGITGKGLFTKDVIFLGGVLTSPSPLVMENHFSANPPPPLVMTNHFLPYTCPT